MRSYTFNPVIKDFIKRIGVKAFTVVAVAAMISVENIIQLIQKDVDYIVGAGMGNLTAELLERFDKQINRQDGSCIRIQTDLDYLIYSYSAAR